MNCTRCWEKGLCALVDYHPVKKPLSVLKDIENMFHQINNFEYPKKGVINERIEGDADHLDSDDNSFN